MYTVVNKSDFIDSFNAIRPDNFSYNGLTSLFRYLEDYEEDTGEGIELDVIAICCEYTEYEDLKEFQANYGDEYKTIEDIHCQTTVIILDDDSFIVQDF